MEASLFPGEGSWLNPSPHHSSHPVGGCSELGHKLEERVLCKEDIHTGGKSLDWFRETQSS